MSCMCGKIHEDRLSSPVFEKNLVTLPSIGIINKIELINATSNDYILVINGHETIKADQNDNNYIFNLDSDHVPPNNILSRLKDIAIGKEPEISNRKDYLNLQRIDTARIKTDCETDWNNVQIVVHGYFSNCPTLEYDTWIKKTVTY
jgi:hypothetical protein